MNPIFFKVLCILHKRGGLIQKIVNKLLMKRGGEYYSKDLRKIYKELYGMDVGIGTYGCFTKWFRTWPGYYTKIGNYCSISRDVDRLIGNHPMHDISTHPFFHKAKMGYVPEDRYIYHNIVIGNDVWIGTKATITSSCEYIGDGAIIGANAVVTHNVEPFAIVAGVPARVIGYRFDEQTRKRILKSKWWDHSPEELRPIMKYSNDIDRFLQELQKLDSQNGRILEDCKS